METPPPVEPRKKLAIRKSPGADAPVESVANPTLHRTVRKPAQTKQWVSFLAALLLSSGIIVGGYYGFKHLHSQITRVSQTEAARRAAEKEAEVQMDAQRTLEAKLQHAEYNAKAEREAAERQFLAKLRQDNEVALQEASRQLQLAKETGSRVIKDLTAERARLQSRLDQLANENTMMKAWLNTHNATLHPQYR